MGAAEEKRPVVWISDKDEDACVGCGAILRRGDFVQVDPAARCMQCAGFGGLVFLASGDAALSRRAARHSSRSAVVVTFFRARKRVERRGALVEAAALARAQVECKADAAKRGAIAVKRRAKDAIADARYIASFEARILELFPSCPVPEAQEIAGHACRKYSGRVGRSAAAKEFEPDAIRLAVQAHVRHQHTEYDATLDEIRDKREARRSVRGAVDDVLSRWRQPHDGAR